MSYILQPAGRTSDFLLALGSNLSTKTRAPSEILTDSLHEIVNEGMRVVAKSRFYQSPAFPAGSGPDFVNAVIAVRSAHSPQQLLEIMHKVEAKFDRTRPYRWSPRSLDIDILAHGDAVRPDLETWAYWANLPLDEAGKRAPSDLILPHPRMHERAFVLKPLCDIAPNWMHPVLGKSARELADALPEDATKPVRPLPAP